MKSLWIALLGAGVAAGCVEFEASPSQRGQPEAEGDDDDAAPAQPEGETESGLPASVVAGLPPDLPQGFIEGRRLGETCNSSRVCREGLTCEDGVCAVTGETALGDFCMLSRECEAGQCVDNICVPFGDGELGTHCLSAAECGEGLRCGIVNLSTQCVQEGNVELGGECKSSNDCFAGLACVSVPGGASTCSPARGAPPGVPEVWTGVACDDPVDDDVRAYFEIPGAPDADELDFFRLPFPNDALLDEDGRVDVSAFPTPGVSPVVGMDPILPYVRAVDGSEGWGTNSTVTFRFSGDIDLDSFKGGDGVEWVDITDPERVQGTGIHYKYYSGRTNYVCHNMLSVRRNNGLAMEPGHTYAVWLGSIGRSRQGDEIERAPNFEAMLREVEPSNSVLAAAHARFAPFRAYLDAQEIDPDDVLVATVITVGPVRDEMAELAQAVLEQDPPSASDWVLCDGSNSSPCPQADDTRGCGDPDPNFDEYHALVELPIFQRGEPPYLLEGGEIQTSSPVRSEPVCMSLSVPKADMPEAGWPLVLFGHGTGGSFRSHVTNGAVARELSEAQTPSGTVQFAVLGFDQVQHGPRRGDSEESPDNLFFNFMNPQAARGNPLQGAADVIALGRFAATLDVSAEESGGDELRIDPERMVFFGHSQGSMHGSLGLPYSPDFKAAVFSGHGVSLMHALLEKTEPVNIRAAVPLVINDGVEIDLSKGLIAGSLPQADHHPVLSLIQHHIDRADPLNFAKQLSRQPVGELLPKHLFQTYGLGDSYSPPVTMGTFAKAAELSVVASDDSADDPDDLGPEASDFPLTSSFTFGPDAVAYTIGVRQYGPPSGSDGHFVAFDVSEATRDVARFLAMAADGQVPQIGE